MTIAALYVQPGGCYWDLPDVDPWGCRETPLLLGEVGRPGDGERDARLYAGPWPVVAHPPCKRWGRYWFGGPSAKVRRKLGDDGGCFAAALASLCQWGGLLEHPEASKAWRHFGLVEPVRFGGWTTAGWTADGRTIGLGRESNLYQLKLCDSAAKKGKPVTTAHNEPKQTGYNSSNRRVTTAHNELGRSTSEVQPAASHGARRWPPRGYTLTPTTSNHVALRDRCPW